MSTTNRPLYLPYAGSTLLETPLLNKGSGFSTIERQSFNLTGLIPPMVESIQEQSERAYKQFSGFESAMDKHVYLRNIQDTNETLFYRLVDNHLEEMMPIIYTPTVGAACQQFSDIYRRARGLFISYPERENIDDILHNVNKQNVKVIVVTDGERILGLGDQGIGGMGIPIGKLSLYTSCGGISPANCLPIVLDVGTNNEKRLQDPMYMGWRRQRIDQDKYNEFLDLFIDAVKRRWPNVLLQFEDFAQQNAMPLLQRYKDDICCFNDDIQGTAAVTLGSLMAACRAAKTKLSEQKVTFLGAGSAGCGIAEQIVAQMKSEGLSDSQARARVFMVDRFGVLTDKMPNLLDFQQKLVQHQGLRDEWGIDSDVISLLDVMTHAKPSILIGVSGQPGLFTEKVIKTMAANTERPIIFPLSNPTSRVEATPQDLIRWTEGRALVATGSPFPPVSYGDELITIAQCNNSYIFPGIGLGVLAAEATRVTNAMLMAASRALADCSPLGRDGHGPLLPPLTEIHAVSKEIAFWVAKTAQLQGVALQTSDESIRSKIEKNFWLPEYREYKRVAN
ncbi:NAD-dependent malic enzyme [Moritella sp. JT01]|uniref:NAD-dependent malic enzyme n=1 Tax=Moritella sp. JT01 TaxID=756698 RepID=UPI000798FE3B|nr:NAD-dependent malic enzyme [Moritella sp. JT01]KXO10120.1 NAD-dependent malic enzyme [Moritella sp. JT01]